MNGIVHHTFAIDIDFHLREAVGLNTVVGSQVRRADYSADGDGLLFAVHEDRLRTFDDEETIRQLPGDSCRKSRGERRIARCSSLPIQSCRTR